MFACCSASTEPEHRHERRVLLQADEVVQERRDHPAHGLRDDHEAQRLAAREPERAGRRLLARVDRLDPGPVHLGDVRAVDEHERDHPPEHRIGRDARSAAGRARRTRAGRRPGSWACRGRGRCRRSPAAAAGRTPGPAGRAGSRSRARRSGSAPRRSVNIFTFSRNARATSGNASRASAPLKNDCLTVCQPGEFTISSVTTTRNTTVLTSAIDTFATAPVPPWRIRERLPGSGWVTSGGRARSPCRRARSSGSDRERAVRLERRDRLVDARRQRAALGEHEAEVAAAARGGRELADDRAVRDLHGGHVEGGRQVDDDAVDLVRLERVDRVVQRVVGGRLRAAA